MAAERRSDQTTTGESGAPVSRSKAITLSPWLASPIATSSAPSTCAIASARVAPIESSSSSPSCSFQPGAGWRVCWRRYAVARNAPASS